MWQGQAQQIWQVVLTQHLNRREVSAFVLIMCRRIQTGAEKAAFLEGLVRQSQARQSQGGARMAVYVGDSMSDLAPLLAADIGIVIGQNKLLRRVAKAAGIRLKSLVCGAALPLAC